MAKVFTITEGLENLGALRTGGQGSVYKARRTGTIMVAVKILPTPIYAESEDDKNFKDFMNEVGKLKKVNEMPTPHVVKILNSGITESGSLPFIEMEFIDGPDLAELLNKHDNPIFSIPEIIKVATQLAAALSHCHKVAVNHGDIKSNNVKYNVNTANYVLIDFGLAIMSNEERRSSLRHAGAVEFMAPEQNEGLMLPQSDVYSYGVVLYELLAGVVPFPLSDNGNSARNNVMLSHRETPAPDVLTLRRQNMPDAWPDTRKDWELQVPEWLTTIINRCLEKDPAKRFADGTELYTAILSQNSALAIKSNTERSLVLQNENQILQIAVEKESKKLWIREREIEELKKVLDKQKQELKDLRSIEPMGSLRSVNSAGNKQGNSPSKAMLIGICLLLFAVGAVAGHFLMPEKVAEPVVGNNPIAAQKEPSVVEKPVIKTNASAGKHKDSVIKQPVANAKPAGADSANNTVVVKDTAKKKPDTPTQPVVKAPVKETSKVPVKTTAPVSAPSDAGKIFALFNASTYFLEAPDAGSAHLGSLWRGSKARLRAIDDINGFIYVIYRNQNGELMKGWINKKDLLKVGD